MKISSQQPQRGIALIIVMVMVFVLAALAGGFALSMKVETKLARNASNEAEYEWLARSGVEYCRWVLFLQLNCAAENYDSLKQVWAVDDPSQACGPCVSNSALMTVKKEIHLGHGSFTWKLTDLERKFNINADAMSGGVILEQALIAMGVDAGAYPEIVASVGNWIDGGQRMGGAESSYYQGLTPAYSAKNGPIDDMSELLLIKGVTPQMVYATNATEPQYDRFGREIQVPHYAFTFPEVFTPISAGRLNINTAPESSFRLMLQAAGMDPAIAAEIISTRNGINGTVGDCDAPFRSPGELVNVPGINHQAASALAQRIATVRSSTFEAEVTVALDGPPRTYRAIIARNNQNAKDIQVLSFCEVAR
jgi:hypothetical protein